MKNKKLASLLALAAISFPDITLAWALPGGFQLPSGTISGIIRNFALWILVILGVAGIIGFVISGILYLLSAGNEKMIDTAKRAMTASIIGIIVGLSGYVIIQAVYYALNGYVGY